MTLAEDLHGLSMRYHPIRALTNAFGIDYTTRDADGLPELAIYSERFISAYEDVYEGVRQDWWCSEDKEVEMVTKFETGRTLFLAHFLGTTSQALRDMEQSFAVLPMPKYDEGQEGYRTETSDAASVIMVPMTVKDRELCGYVLESMNYESYQIVTPAYFETTLQAKYMRDEDSQEMLSIIRESIYYDFGYIFSGLIGGGINSMMQQAMTSSNHASLWASKSPAMQKNLDKLLEYFRQ